MSRPRKLHLNLNFQNNGSHAASWLWPESDPLAFTKVDYFVRIAKIAERGTFDAIFFADRPAFPENAQYRPAQAFEPTILLTAIAAQTSHIGLLATASSTYNEPYNIARRYASLDHISGGRAGINIVTTADAQAAPNFGLDSVPEHEKRYARADEFADILKALWASWQPGAISANKQSGQYFDRSRINPIDHEGEFFSVRGPLNVPRTPQGRPIIVQAGGSPAGRDLAAKHADAVFSVAQTLQEAIEYAQDLRARAVKFGRRAEDILNFPGLATILGDTEQAALRREEELAELVPVEQGLNWFRAIFDIDPSRLHLDRQLPDDLKVPQNGMTTFAQNVIKKARENNFTLRELIRSQGGGGNNHRPFVGTPEQVATQIIEWFHTGAIDGFNLMPDVLPSGLDVFVDEVVPLLRRAGVFREHYEGTTLREHFGLELPREYSR